MFSTLLIDDGRRDSAFKSKSVSEIGGEKQGFTFAKLLSWIKLFSAHLFSHVGLSALVVGYSIAGAFIFSYLEGANEIAIRKVVGNNRKDTLEELYNITESLRLTVISKEMRIRDLESELHILRESRKRCKHEKKLQYNFLESVITEYKGDNVPLTDKRCSQFCKMNNLQLGLCKALCVSEAKPCNYWHLDTVKQPDLLLYTDFLSVVNRSRRDLKEYSGDFGIWKSRLRSYRELGNVQHDESQDADFLNESEHDEGGLWEIEYLGEPKEWQVVVPQKNKKTVVAQCRNISCIEGDDIKTVVCLDMNLLGKPPGYFAGNTRARLLENPKHFNVLWKQNWTKEAEKILKLFERDVILKVRLV